MLALKRQPDPTPELGRRLCVLKLIAEALEEAGVEWTLCCSAGLYGVGIVDKFGDFDILVDEKDFEPLKETLQKVGVEMLPTKQKSAFGTPYYQQARFYYEGEAIEFDLIAKFWVMTFDTQYCYDFKKEDIEFFEVDGKKIPVLAVEVQLVLYAMMEGWQKERCFKRRLCFDYLKRNGVKRPGYLAEVSLQNVPSFLKEVIRELLENKS